MDTFVVSHPYLGYGILTIVLGIIILFFIADSIPKLQILKGQVYKPIAKKLRFRKLVRAASKADIQGNVNVVLRKFSHELPKNWIKEMDLEWVTFEDPKDFLNDNEPVIRVRPLEDQDLNFVRTAYSFLRKSFFPETKAVIPSSHREASVLFISDKVIKDQKSNLTKLFENHILEPAIEKDDKIINILERYRNIDSRGLFTGTFLREVHSVATEVRLTSLRDKMRQETSGILNHIEDFIKQYDQHIANPTNRSPDGVWYRTGPVTQYSFLLVAAPYQIVGGVNKYVNRAKERATQGIDRLYVFGTEEERSFAVQVINAIEKLVPEYHLDERFLPSKDYRGNVGGVGALFIKHKTG